MKRLNLKTLLTGVLGLYSLGAMAEGGATGVGGGADGCYVPGNGYECTVGTDVGDGTIWEKKLSFPNSADEVDVRPQLTAGLCVDKNFHGVVEVHAWLRMESSRYKDVSSLAQVHAPLDQKELQLLVNLVDGDRSHSPKYYWMKCVKNER